MKRTIPRPPGPPGIPLFGSAIACRRDPTGSLERISRQYDDIVHGRFHPAITLRPKHPVYLRVRPREADHG